MNQSQQRSKWRGDQPAANERGDGWRVAFHLQLSEPGLHRSVLRAARGCVRLLHQGGAQVASAYAEDLVADAIADTWSGVLSWDPGESSLLDHLKAAIRSRARHQWHRSKRFPAPSLDAEEDEEDDRAAALWAEVEESLASDALAADAERRILAREVIARLRMLATDDPELVTVLEAMAAGATERADLVHATGLPARRLESIRRRLDRLLPELPASTRPGVRAVCACTSTRHRSATLHRRAAQRGTASPRMAA